MAVVGARSAGKKGKDLQHLDCLQQTPGRSLPVRRRCTDNTSTANSSRRDLTKGAEQSNACARDLVSFPKALVISLARGSLCLTTSGDSACSRAQTIPAALDGAQGNTKPTRYL